MNREELKQDVLRFYNRNKSRGKIFTVKHFLKQGETESTIYYILKQAERNPTPNKRTPLADASNTPSPQTSGRVVKRTSTPKNKVSQALNLMLEGYSSKGEKMLESCQERCGNLIQKYKGQTWILDNCASFSLANNQGGKANSGYIMLVSEIPPPPRKRDLFIPKLEVWVGFSNKGISEPFIQQCSTKFDGQVYLEECVKKRLVPFVKENHADLSNTVLWTDAGVAFTNKKVVDHFESENIKHVGKEDNPGNRVKCFSYFWNLLRNYVYEGEWEAANEQMLEDRIKECLKKIDMENVVRIANNTESRIEEMVSAGEIKEWSDKRQRYTDLFRIKYGR